jgi:hypothetical protein
MKKYYLLAFSILFMLGACKKTDFDTTVTGEALGAFQLASPAVSSHLLLNPATPAETIEFSWTAAKPGVNAAPVYSVVFVDDNTTLENPYLTVLADNEGKDPKKTFTHQSLANLLAEKGMTLGGLKNFRWAVKASNGTTDVFTELRPIDITTAKDGTTGFILLSPASSAETITLNPVSSADSLKFNWTKSVPSAGSPAVKYTVVLTPTEEGRDPFRFESNQNGTDTLFAISHEDLANALTDAGYTDAGAVLHFNWSVEAKTGDFVLKAQYDNELALNREVNMFLVGTFNGWNINEGIKMILDKRNFAKVFYSYIQVGAEPAKFKFFAKSGDWDSGYGDKGVAAPNGGVETGYHEGGDIEITTPGIYRLTIDIENNVYYIQEKQVGIVGDVPGQGWNVDSPLFGMYTGNNSFTILVSGEEGKEFKLHEGGGWESGLPYQPRYYGRGNADGLLVEPGDNLKLVNTGVNKVVFDGSNVQQLKYQITAYQMKMRGGGAFGGWDFGNAISMNYEGNGIWKGSVTLTAAEIFKFCATDDWSINYGASSTANVALFNSNDNISIGAGSWQIQFNEYTLAYSITPL